MLLPYLHVDESLSSVGRMEPTLRKQRKLEQSLVSEVRLTPALH